MKLSKRTKLVALSLAALVFVTGAKMWNDTLGDPSIEQAQIALRGLDPALGPVRIALISDIHVAGPDMPPARLERIVEQINALDPDIVAIAGDFVSDKRTATHIYTPEEIIAPIAKLRSTYGIVAVPGNHDHWFDLPSLVTELERYDVHLLANSSLKVGPITFAGLDDAYTGRADLPATLDSAESLGGPVVILSHSPDPAAQLSEDNWLFLAGHTHCGQIAYPWGGAPAHLSKYGDRFACGRIDERTNTIIVGAGLGTSLIPLRLFTQPEIWVIDLVAP